MAVQQAGAGATSRARLARGLLAAAAALPFVAAASQPVAQTRGVVDAELASLPREQMLLEADQLHYDFDRQTVTAIGNVQIYYGGAYLDAARVTYDQKSGRLTASGGARLLEPNGNLIAAETIDVTDDLRNGFVESINMVTIDNARFSAQSAERRNGNLLIFRKGVYTACAACADNPDRPPLWRIKAARIVHDQAEQTVYYEHATFEFMGTPIAYTPIFFHPDPTVRRKTGFLAPSLLHSDDIGFGVKTPFFWNLAPNYDVTFSPTFLTKQGLLSEIEWRHRVMNGAYSIRLAGIFQRDKDEFLDDGEKLNGYEDFRGSAHTAGEFALSDRWRFGWEAHAALDRTFNRDYMIEGASSRDLTSTIYLTGLSERNFFDLRGYHFLVQRENTVDVLPGEDYVHSDQAEQPVVHPVLDHNYVVDRAVLGGELRFDSNLTSLSREASDIRHPLGLAPAYYAGPAGTFTRATSRASWQRRFIAPAGQLITPFTYMQADLSWISADDAAAALSSDDVVARAMPAVGLDYEWPILAISGASVHTFGPRAQIIARPGERRPGDLSNEDAQSLVFDDTNLFEWDKFSGFDRQEGGTRANLGFVYQGLFGNGATVDAVIGQSFQLAGDNSFAMQDISLTGLGSGLEEDVSDYIGRVTLNTGTGLALTARTRLDEDTLSMNRSELNAVGSFGETVAWASYAYIRESPSAGVYEDRQEVTGATSLAMSRNWSLLAGMIYDIQNESPVTRSLGLGYADDCLELSAVYSETLDRYSDLSTDTDRQLFVRINLRTLTEESRASLLDKSLD